MALLVAEKGVFNKSFTGDTARQLIPKFKGKTLRGSAHRGEPEEDEGAEKWLICEIIEKL